MRDSRRVKASLVASPTAPALRALVVSLVLLPACKQREVPPDPGGMPAAAGADRAGPAAGARAAPPRVPGGGIPVAGELPPGHPPVGATHGEIDPGAKLEGTIVVAAALKAQVAPADVIFLVARIDDGSEKGGAILGVKRYTAAGLPVAFLLDGRDAMNPGIPFAGDVLLTARVDKDGDPMTKPAGDVLGVARATVPRSGITLTLDTITR